MADILSVKYDLPTCEALLDKKLKKGDLIGALSTLNRLEEAGGNKINLCTKRAKIYFDMRQFAKSGEEWIKYLSLVKDEKLYGKAYNGLGACFYRMGEKDLAGYYFNRQIMSSKKAVYDYSYVTAEFYEDVLDPKKNYRLAYPYDKADLSSVIEEAELMLKSGDSEGALKALSVVPETSKYYGDALITSSIAKYFRNDTEGALIDAEKAVVITGKTIAVCNAFSMFKSAGNEDKAKYYYDLLVDTKLDTDEDVYKVTMVHLENGNDLLASNLSAKYLRKNPYDTTMLLFKGQIEYNLKNYALAEDCFKKAYLISGSYASYYYINVAQNKAIDGRLEYSFDIPTENRFKLVKRTGELLKLSCDKKLEFSSEIMGIASYAFSSPVYQLQSTAITLLSELETEEAKEFMKQTLLKINVFDRIKSGVLGFLAADGYEGELGAVFGNVFRKIPFYKAVFGAQAEKTFIEAYAYAFAKIAPIESDTKSLRDSIEDVYMKLDEKGLLFMELDVKALAAVAYELSGIAKINSRREFSKYFDASLRKIKEIKELIK